MRGNGEQLQTLKPRVERAWIAKIDLRLDEALGLLTEVKTPLGIPTGYLSEAQVNDLVANEPSDLVFDVLSLSAELERCFGSPARAKELVASVERAQRLVGGVQSFWVAYTKAVGLFASGDFSVAFEEFLRARARATSASQKIIAESNLVFCLENQGLPYEQTKESLKTLLGDPEVAEPIRRRVTSQLYALSLREMFRAGKISKVLETEKKRKATAVDQGFYFSLWVTQLPYSTSFRTLGADDYERFATGTSYQHFRDYRLRTLQGVLHPDERDLCKPTEFVDRLYLWTWRWLSHPEPGSIEKVLVLLREFLPKPLNHRLTVEDTLLLTNALLWISLFDPPSTVHVRRLIGQFEMVHTAEYPILRFENLTIHCLLALRDGKEPLASEYWNTLRQHPLWSSQETLFPELVDVAMGRGTKLPSRLQALEELLKSQREERSQHRITLDLGTGEIRKGEETMEPLFSRPICAAFYLLKNYGRASSEVFANLCFGIHTYDPFIHGPKIQNLLSRMKQIAQGQLRFGMKNNTVFVEGSWDGFFFKQGPALSGFVQQVMEIESGLFGETPSVAQSNPVSFASDDIFRRPEWGEGITRNQIEGLLSRPRSTVNRMLKRWMDEGKIVRSGNTRSSKYFLSESFRSLRGKNSMGVHYD